MISLISGASKARNTPIDRQMLLLAQAARMQGLNVYEAGSLWPNFVLRQARDDSVIFLSGEWFGHRAYQNLENDLNQTGHKLISSAEETMRAMDLLIHYPLLSNHLAATIIANNISEVEQAYNALGPDVFIKGLVKSKKEGGRASCFAYEKQEALDLYQGQPLAVREILDLKTIAADSFSFPMSREYRSYLMKNEVISTSFYWQEKDPFGRLSQEDKESIKKLAEEVGGILKVPFLAVDIAQEKNGQWRVIEVGDPQFSGIAHMNHHQFITELKARF